MWQQSPVSQLPKNYSDSWNPREYSGRSTVDLQNYAANLRNLIERGKAGNGKKPWNSNGIFETRMEERLEGLERLVQGRLTMEDFKSGPPKPETISELYWKPREGPTLSSSQISLGTTSKPGLTTPEEVPTSSSVEQVRKQREFDSILKEGREVREREESLRRSTRIAEKRKAIHALLPTPGMPISLQLHSKRHKTAPIEDGSLEDSENGEKELEIDPLLQ